MRQAVPDGFEPRAVCPRCRRAARVCYCAHLPRVETATRVVILQHPRERDMPIGTAHMASLCLPNAELHVGTSAAAIPALARSLADPARPAILLYPGEGAIDVATDPPRGPVTLVVVDGTWSQALKIVRHDPVLARLPRYAFNPRVPSEYRIRREPSIECVSTIEAIVYVLGALEGDEERFRALLRPFRAMVDAQLAHAASVGRARVRHVKRPRVTKPRLPSLLRERARDLVCVVGEANAWPYTSPERARHPEELVHWAAVRVATGETFEHVIAPRHPLAPGTLRWIELSRERLEGGSSVAEFTERWAAFTRESDVVVSWGNYAHKVLAADARDAAPARTRIDARESARAFARGKVGTLDDFLRTIDRPPRALPLAGRAGRRVGQLVAIAEFLGAA